MMHMVKVLNEARIGTVCGLPSRELLTAAITNVESQVTCADCNTAAKAEAEREQAA